MFNQILNILKQTEFDFMLGQFYFSFDNVNCHSDMFMLRFIVKCTWY